MRSLLLLLGVASLSAAAMHGPAGRGLVYASPVSTGGSRHKAVAGGRYTAGGMASAFRYGRQHQVVAAQMGGNVVGDTVFGGFHNFLSLYNLVLTARILLSWFPQFARQPVFEPLFIVTNPFFNIFRGLIPPIGGVDLSPLPAFFLLSFVTQATESLGAEPSRAPLAKSGRATQPQDLPSPSSSTLVRCGAFRFHVPAGVARRFAPKAAH